VRLILFCVSVSVTLDALPELHLRGVVASIAPLAMATSGAHHLRWPISAVWTPVDPRIPARVCLTPVLLTVHGAHWSSAYPPTDV
jgi:hypothetical protein